MLGFVEEFDGYMEYDLGRDWKLVIGFCGTPNEVLIISAYDSEDVIILHNWDYDGYLTETKLQNLIKSIGTKTR